MLLTLTYMSYMPECPEKKNKSTQNLLVLWMVTSTTSRHLHKAFVDLLSHAGLVNHMAVDAAAKAGFTLTESNIAEVLHYDFQSLSIILC